MKIKSKGAYAHEDLGWHQNHSSLVIQKAAEYALVYGGDFEEFIRNHDDKYDFMLRTKVPRSSRLVLEKDDKQVVQQNICRYYISEAGGKLIKIMPPLEGKFKTETTYKDPLTLEQHKAITNAENARFVKKGFEVISSEILPPEERPIGIDKDWNVKICNNIHDFEWDIDYDYYIEEARKLVEPLLEPQLGEL